MTGLVLWKISTLPELFVLVYSLIKKFLKQITSTTEDNFFKRLFLILMAHFFVIFYKWKGNGID